MTDRQFSALRTTVTGAAFFIGGALLYLESEDIGTISMVFGGILMLKDVIISALIKILEGNLAADNVNNREKEERNNESD